MNQEPETRQLLRSPNDRVIAGVAGGLGRYFNIDPIIFRIGFVALIFAGGLGTIAYLAAMLFVPQDDGTGNPKPVEWTRMRVFAAVAVGVVALAILSSGPLWWIWDGDAWEWGFTSFLVIVLLIVVGGRVLLREGGPRRSMTPRRLVGLIALAFGGVVLASVLAIGGAWATAEGAGLAAALVVVALGLAMVATSVAGMRTAWLAIPALAIAIPAGAVAATGFELHGSYGSRMWTPLSFDRVPDEGYEMAVGEMEVDLRELPWKRGRTLDLETDLGMGQMRVLVPEDVCVALRAHADGGAVYYRGDEDGGVDYERTEPAPDSSVPLLRLDADVGFGEIVVADRDRDRGHDWHDDDDDEEADLARERARRACVQR